MNRLEEIDVMADELRSNDVQDLPGARTDRVDQAAMAELVHRALRPPVASKLTRCPSWPGLAKRLEAWQQQGLAVEAMLESLPAWRITVHPRPARYATNLMSRSVDRHLANLAVAAYIPVAIAVGGTVDEVDDLDGLDGEDSGDAVAVAAGYGSGGES